MKTAINLIKGDKRVWAVILVAILLVAFNAHLLNVASDDNYHTGIPPADINYSETMHNVWGCAGVPYGGCWVGNIEPDYTELIMDDANNPVVTSFKPYGDAGQGDVGLSESITVYGTITLVDGSIYTWAPNTGYYKVSIYEGGTWKPIIWDGGIDEAYVYKMAGTTDVQQWEVAWWDVSSSFDLAPLTFKLKGAHVGALHIEVVTDFVNLVVFHETHTTSEDWCYLVSGSGSINIAGYAPYDIPMFEMGASVPIVVAADYSGPIIDGTGRWELRYYGQGSGLSGTIMTWDYDWVRTTYDWDLPAGLWFRGITDSKVTIELWNTLFPQAYVMVNTIDLIANAPPTPSITASDYDPVIGDTINVYGSCNTNINTNELVVTFHIIAVYTDNNQQIGYWTGIIPTGQDPSTYSHSIPNLPRAGTVKVQVLAHDAGGRESAVPGVATITVHDPNADEYTDWIKVIICAIIIIIFLLAGLITPTPPYAKAIIIIVGIVIAILVYVFIDFTPLTDWLNAQWWL